MLADKPWRYAVRLVNEKTGEQRTVVVTLSAAEQFDAVRNMGECGPVANRYAMDHAGKDAPAGFIPTCDGIERVVVH